MQWALLHLVLLCFACAFSWVGWLMAHYPQKAARFFTFGRPETKFAVSYCRIIGWIFAAVFALGAIVYLILIPLDLLGIGLGK